MIDVFTFMAAPIAACIVLVLMHAYLGAHILSRGVIFVDLALAQIAARRFAQCGVVAGEIQNVVHNLEGHTKIVAELIEVIDARFG